MSNLMRRAASVLTVALTMLVALPYLATAQTHFGSQRVINTLSDANGAVSVFAADLDGDTDFDVLSASAWDDKIAWYENQTTSTAVETLDLPEGYHLSPAYPNPFNPTTSFTLTLVRPQRVTVAVFDVLGRRVAHLHQGLLLPGQAHWFVFEAGALPSGVYVYRATGEDFAASGHVVLVR